MKNKKCSRCGNFACVCEDLDKKVIKIKPNEEQINYAKNEYQKLSKEYNTCLNCYEKMLDIGRKLANLEVFLKNVGINV